MPDPNPPERGFEDRLASMERRLSEIKNELGFEVADEPEIAVDESEITVAEPEPEPEPGPEPEPQPDPQPEPEPARAAADPDLLNALYANLLAAARRLVDGYEGALRDLHGQSPSNAEATVSAGPFHSTDSLRDFERDLAALPGVREVAIRGYQAGDRAILEVQLEPETT